MSPEVVESTGFETVSILVVESYAQVRELLIELIYVQVGVALSI